VEPGRRLALREAVEVALGPLRKTRVVRVDDGAAERDQRVDAGDAVLGEVALDGQGLGKVDLSVM